jgi:hypothetical protein
MSEEEVLEKFRSNAKTVISDQQTEELLAAMKNLEKLDKVGKIVELLTPKN